MIRQSFKNQINQYVKPTKAGENLVDIEKGLHCYIPEIVIEGGTEQEADPSVENPKPILITLFFIKLVFLICKYLCKN